MKLNEVIQLISKGLVLLAKKHYGTVMYVYPYKIIKLVYGRHTSIPGKVSLLTIIRSIFDELSKMNIIQNMGLIGDKHLYAIPRDSEIYKLAKNGKEKELFEYISKLVKTQ